MSTTAEILKRIVGMLDVLKEQGHPDHPWPQFAIMRAQVVQLINELEEADTQ